MHITVVAMDKICQCRKYILISLFKQGYVSSLKFNDYLDNILNGFASLRVCEFLIYLLSSLLLIDRLLAL